MSILAEKIATYIKGEPAKWSTAVPDSLIRDSLRLFF